MLLKIIYRNPFPWVLEVEEATGRYFLATISRGPYITGLRVELTPDEVASFRANPDALTALARKLGDSGRLPDRELMSSPSPSDYHADK